MDSVDELDAATRVALRGELTHGRSVQAWADVRPHRIQLLLRLLTGWIWRWGFRARAVGVEHVPATGPVLLCPNHSSWIDGFIQCIHQPRDVRIFGKVEALQIPLVGRFLGAGGVFPVVRNAHDARAREIARLVLEQGGLLVIYPEGTRKGHPPGELGRPRSGAALLALQTGTPIIPVASVGIRRWGEPRRWRWPRVTTCYGEPMHFDGPPTPERVAQVRDEVWARVAELRAQALSASSTRG
jgi:1-acyl-sn-glycerol-3-phosphate acyltransferase